MLSIFLWEVVVKQEGLNIGMGLLVFVLLCWFLFVLVAFIEDIVIS